ncbi:MAG: RDD family protein [Streptococcaceae bacterium]|jgi:hypothetical protein|nr:RDD family protein [Streptococcaceae bacterium]
MEVKRFNLSQRSFLLLIQRLLSALIDVILIYLPALIAVSILFGKVVSGNVATLIASFLFVIYNIIAVVSFRGQTLGKYFAKLQVEDGHTFGENAAREGVKVLYFLPFFGGAFFSLISLIIYLIRGEFLHDWIAKMGVNVHG